MLKKKEVEKNQNKKKDIKLLEKELILEPQAYLFEISVCVSALVPTVWTDPRVLLNIKEQPLNKILLEFMIGKIVPSLHSEREDEPTVMFKIPLICSKETGEIDYDYDYYKQNLENLGLSYVSNDIFKGVIQLIQSHINFKDINSTHTLAQLRSTNFWTAHIAGTYLSLYDRPWNPAIDNVYQNTPYQEMKDKQLDCLKKIANLTSNLKGSQFAIQTNKKILLRRTWDLPDKDKALTTYPEFKDLLI